MRTFTCTITVPDTITREHLDGEIREALRAGYDLPDEDFTVEVVEQAAAAA